MKKIPILIDTDPGVDDFFCLAIGCAFPDLFDLRAVTTIGGNNSTDVTTRNALDILKLFHREDVTVSSGADRFLMNEFGEPVAKFHGINGLGNVDIPHTEKEKDPRKAWDRIHDEAIACEGELVVVTVGPETNLALALQKYPDLKHLIKKITVMGGSLTTGNVSEYAEANLWHDAEAARIVFDSGIPIDMIGLNVTRKAPLKRSIFEGLKDIRKDVKDVMERLIDFRNEEAMHDAIAIATLVDDDIMTWRTTHTSVIDGEDVRRGMSLTDDTKEPNSRVAEEIDIERYYDVMRRMISQYTEKPVR